MAYPQPIEVLRNTPIPDLKLVREQRQGARKWPIDLDTSYAREMLLEVGVRGISHYAHDLNPPYYEKILGSISELYVRSSVKEKLHEINSRLQDARLELHIFDAWRTQATQTYCRDVWFYNYLQLSEPSWSEERIREEIGKYWAAGPNTEEGIDIKSPPPHATGGVVDISIAFLGGEQLWMGTIFDDVSAAAHTDYLEKHVPQERSFTYLEALKNRRLLYWLMSDAGFEVNPNEWWHFSWGDQLWAKLQSWRTGAHIPAHYSAALPPNWSSRTPR